MGTETHQGGREERGDKRKRKKKETCRRGSNPSFRGLEPSSRSTLARGEYRLSVVRLGVLHSSKYLGIFQESRAPKKTVYSVGRRVPSRESPNTPRARGTVIASVFRRRANAPGYRGGRKKIYKGKMYEVRSALPRLCACSGLVSCPRIALGFEFAREYSRAVIVSVPPLLIELTTVVNKHTVFRSRDRPDSRGQRRFAHP